MKRKRIPSWATVRKSARRARSTENPGVRSGSEDEEQYLRTRAFQLLSRQIDESLRGVLRSSIDPIVQDMVDFFGLSTTNNDDDDDDDDDDHRGDKKEESRQEEQQQQSTERSSSLASRFVVSAPTKYSQDALSVALLEGPADLTDRRACIHALMDSLRSLDDRRRTSSSNSSSNSTTHNSSTVPRDEKISKKRTATCLLQKTDLAVAGVNHGGPLLDDILHQCLDQEDRFGDGSNRFRAIRGKRKPTKNPIDRLVAWARHTNVFDSVVVVLQDIERMSEYVLRHFLAVLGELRCRHRIPVHAILLNPFANHGDFPFRSSMLGSGGLICRRFDLPVSSVLHDQLWESMVVERRIPILLTEKSFDCLNSVFQNLTGSFSRSVQVLKHLLTSRCAHAPLSFLLDDEVFRKEEGDRLFGLDDTAQATNIIETSRRRRRRKLRDWTEVVGGMLILSRAGNDNNNNNNNNTKPIGAFELIGMMTKKEPHNLDNGVTRILGASCNGPNMPMFRALMRCRASFTSRKLLDDFDDVVVEPLEQILMLWSVSMRSNMDGRFDQELGDMVKQWVQNCVEWAQVNLQLLWHRGRVEACIAECSESVLAEQRRQVTESLVHPESAVGFDQITGATTTLYGLIRDSLEIGREEWFRLYHQVEGSETPITRLRLLFGLGIYQLSWMGLVNEKGQGTNVKYEKTHVVWCNG